MAAHLIAHPHDHLIAYSRPIWNLAGFFMKELLTYDCIQQRWIRQKGHTNETLTQLLGARSFMSTPVSLRKQRGRLYVVSNNGAYNKEDTLFLNQIVEPALLDVPLSRSFMRLSSAVPRASFSQTASD